MSPSNRLVSARPRTLAILFGVLFAALLFASPTQSFAASKFKVRSSVKSVVKSGSTSKVVIVAKATRRAKITVKITHNGKVVRVYGPRGKRTRQKISWTTRDASGKKVAAGTYRITVIAKRGSKTVTSRRYVRVRRYVKPWIGFYVPGVPNRLDPLYSIESATDIDAKVLNFFINDSDAFPLSKVRNARAAGAVPMITLEFFSAENGGVRSITNGSKDSYLRAMADSARNYGGEVWLRPFHEMNGTWYPWGGTVNGNSPARVIAAWRHVHAVFRSRGATNVKFVWSVNNESVPNTTANSIRSYWPGSSYVDRVAIDGYNFGSNGPGGWRSFTSVFSRSYSTVTKLTGKPIILAETACATTGGSKSAWISDMFRVLPSRFPRIRGIVWFNEDKEHDWRVESSSTSLNAFSAGFAGL